MSPIFSLIGDSNIQRHVNKNSIRANPALKAAQMLTCGSPVIFAATLEKVRQSSTACIVSCVTNFITDCEGPSTLSLRVDPVLQDLRSVLLEACSTNPERAYLISPPMYRTHPIWYREGLPEVMTLFSQVLSADKPANLHVLPSFATPDFESDGVHLTAYSGLEFILHLFDGAAELLANVDLPLPERAIKGSESTRVLEDRMMALEQDHRRLNRVVEAKTAADAELDDFHANERTEDFFVVSGLPRIPSDIVGKPWQTQAVKDVSDLIQRLMGRSMSIVFVKNSTQRYEDAEVTYSVQMASVADSSAIRKKFGSFFLQGARKLPDELSGISIKNFVTPETRIRISVLKLLAKKYRESNPGSIVKVIGYQPRPVIKIVPPASATDRRVMTYNYVEAVTRLPCRFSPAEIEPITRRINPKLQGQVRSLFIVLTDDSIKKKGPKSGAPSTQAAPATVAQPPESAPDGSDNESVSSNRSASTVASTKSQAPAPTVSTKSSKSGRGEKRGASPPRGSVAKK